MKTTLTNYLRPFFIIMAILFIFISCDNESDDNELSSETGEVVDIDGNKYNTVKIGEQWWMAENLRVTKYRNGEVIPVVSDSSEWTNLKSGAYSWYQNDYETKGKYYGALYNWYAVESESELCPDGWHVPNDNEWSELFDYLGGELYAGGKLKSTNTEPAIAPRWDSPNDGANNESGFSAFPGGNRNPNGEFNYIGKYGFWWSSTEWVDNEYLAICLSNDHFGVLPTDVYVNFKSTGYNVRCIKDN